MNIIKHMEAAFVLALGAASLGSIAADAIAAPQKAAPQFARQTAAPVAGMAVVRVVGHRHGARVHGRA